MIDGCPILESPFDSRVGLDQHVRITANPPAAAQPAKPSAPSEARASPSSLSSPPRHSRSSRAAYPSTLRACHKAATALAGYAADPSPQAREQRKACTTSSRPACSPSASYKSPDSPCPTTPPQPVRTMTNSHPSPVKKQSARRSHSREYF